MKFFFPDSQDQVDPDFDFLTEERPAFRVRQRDELYAHEVLSRPSLDGLLVSRAIVDGRPGSGGKYTLAQRHRFYRVGVRKFFRVDDVEGPTLQTMGDCGAFSYVREEKPPYHPDEVIDFYEQCRFDLGVSVDHVILGYASNVSDEPDDERLEVWMNRQELTLELAAEFLKTCKARRVRFEPVGVAQGWSPRSYATAVGELQRMGYRRIAIGGMVPLKTNDIIACLKAIDDERACDTQLHLLGITRCDNLESFAFYGVTSFDSTSPFRQAFKDDKNNYYTLERKYTAIRVPQVDGNPKLKERIKAGRVSQSLAVEREQRCLTALRRYDSGELGLRPVLDALRSYEELLDGGRDYVAKCEDTLKDRPWKSCQCGICEKAGIDVALFRGSERNKRRGFHNLYVFKEQLDRQLAAGSGA